MHRILTVTIATLLTASSLAFANSRFETDVDTNAKEAADLVQHVFDEADPEVSQVLSYLEVLQTQSHVERLKIAEAGVSEFGFTVLEDDRQLESGCGTVAINDLHDCQDACQLNTSKRFCGCAAAFVMDAIACVH